MQHLQAGAFQHGVKPSPVQQIASHHCKSGAPITSLTIITEDPREQSRLTGSVAAKSRGGCAITASQGCKGLAPLCGDVDGRPARHCCTNGLRGCGQGLGDAVRALVGYTCMQGDVEEQQGKAEVSKNACMI